MSQAETQPRAIEETHMTDPQPYPGTPHWVKVFGVIAIVLVLLVLSAVLTGVGRPHGPGRHASSGYAGGDTRRGLVVLLGVLVVAGVALNWSWLVAFRDALPRHSRPHTVQSRPWWPHVAGERPSMTMTPRLRKLALTAHVASSVGLFGAVASFLALAVAGLTSQDARVVRAAYIAGGLTAWFVIVPLSFASLLTGLVQALGTPWGLFRNYWVLAKFLLTVLTIVVLLLQMEGISHIAGVAGGTTLSSGDLLELRRSLTTHAAGGLLVLLVTTTLSVYKPRGMTRYGWRKHQEGRALSQR